MKLRHIFGENGRPDRFFIDGKEVSKKRYDRALRAGRPKSKSKGVGGNRPWARPVVAESLAVHPSQIKEVIERNRKHGLHVEYNDEGTPILRDRDQRRRLIEIENTVIEGGVRDNDGGYGDMTRTEARPHRKANLSKEFVPTLNVNEFTKAAIQKFFGRR